MTESGVCEYTFVLPLNCHLLDPSADCWARRFSYALLGPNPGTQRTIAVVLRLPNSIPLKRMAVLPGPDTLVRLVSAFSLDEPSRWACPRARTLSSQSNMKRGTGVMKQLGVALDLHPFISSASHVRLIAI